MDNINTTYRKMIAYYSNDPMRSQHFTKVHSYAKLIGQMEKLDKKTLETLELTALVHDIGIKVSEEKYGKSDGKLQEKEGPDAARELFADMKLEKEQLDRICYLIAHHHTYYNIDGPDYQILVEADFIVNAYEDGMSAETADKTYKRIFKTESGKRIFAQMFGISDKYVVTPQLDTERMILRPLSELDAHDVYVNWTSDPEVAKYMIWTLHTSEDVTKKWLKEEAGNINSYTNFTFGFELKANNNIIGSGGLVYNEKYEMWEIGYNIMRDCWHQGFASEAVKEILDFGHNVLGINHVLGRHALENVHSGDVLKKMGFEYVNDDEYTTIGGEIYKCCIYNLDYK